MIYTLSLNTSIDKTIYVDEDNKTIYSAGGKGINVSKTIKLLNRESISLGFIGGDNSNIITDRLDELKIKYDYVHIKNNIRTNTKLIDRNGNLTERNEKGPHVDISEIDAVIEKIKELLKEDDILVLSGSVCLDVDLNIYKQLTNIANNIKAKVILDADNELFKNAIEAKPYLIKPNIHELCNYYNIEETNDIKILIPLCKKLIDKGIKQIMLSMGKDGALYIDKDEVYIIEPLDINIRSTVGAGDAMVGALAISISENHDTITKLKLAAACASGACLSEGTEPASYDTVYELMSRVIITKEDTI